MDKLQPIETIPIGEWVLVFSPYRGMIAGITLGYKTKRNDEIYNFDGGRASATHWMYLPHPPEVSE